jgi:hypothetical protein
MRHVRTCVIVIGLLASAKAARAQVMFRGFIGPTQATCEDFDGTARKMMVGGGSIGKHGGQYIDFGVGAITNLCAFKPDRVLVNAGMHLFPAVLLNGSLSIGVGLNVDWDIPEMQRSFKGEGTDDAYLFFRPELAVRALWSVGERRTNDNGNAYREAAVGFEAHVGRYRYSGNYFTIGVIFALN